MRTLVKYIIPCVVLLLGCICFWLDPLLAQTNTFIFDTELADDKYMGFGTDADFQIIFDSATGDLEVTDGTNNLLTLSDDGTTGTLTVEDIAVSDISPTGNLDVTGTIEAGSGNIALTNATGNILGDSIADNTVDASELEANSVDTSEIAADAVGASELDENADVTFNTLATTVDITTGDDIIIGTTDFIGLTGGATARIEFTDADSITLQSAEWLIPGGDLIAGADDTTQGDPTLYGGASGDTGAEIHLYNDGDSDTTTEFWDISADGALRFKADGSAVRLSLAETGANSFPSGDVQITSGDLVLADGDVLHVISTLPDGGTTPTVTGAKFWYTFLGSAATITAMTGSTGQEIVIIATDNNTTLTDALYLNLNGNWTPDAADTISLVCTDGTSWYETSRSAN